MEIFRVKEGQIGVYEVKWRLKVVFLKIFRFEGFDHCQPSLVDSSR